MIAVASAALGVALVLASASPAVADTAAATRNAWRGTFLATLDTQSVSQKDIGVVVAKSSLTNPKTNYGVDAYTILYGTVDANGFPTTASGLVVLPRDGGGMLRPLVFEHGTRSARTGVATREKTNDDRYTALLIGSTGYAAIAPDYLGLGYGPGYHPYLNAATETSASLDLLRAARTVAGRHGRKLDANVRVTGFSQGGQAAMALAKALQSGVDPRLRLAGVATISGPFDAQYAEIPAGLVTRTLDQPGTAFYLAYATVSMNRLFHVYRDPSEVFKAPYDKTVESLFDGSHEEAVIFPALPANPDDLLTDSYRRRLLNPQGQLLQAFQASDGTCAGWRPSVPMRLFAASGDEQVAFANSQNCQQQLRASGADVPLVNLGGIHHFDTRDRAVPMMLDWFTHQH
ncbi:Secretory lipase [Amycolatopsis australiensis]|uniref:Secretory lipase n=1 Tax=Amycolatopsis australiensis TaxID=546364 RepID=A0A1K1RRN9_9PSEU|nr:Secretory lipase [Amycolatopsis australiensis]